MGRPKRSEENKKSEKIVDIKTYLGVLENEWATVAEDGIPSADITGYIDTGAYMVNALVCGSIFGGFPDNKITMLAGDPGVGKTFTIISTILAWQKDPNAIVIFYESESAITKKMLVERGVDTKRVLIAPIETAQEFRTQSLKFVEKHLSIPENKRLKVLLLFDSMGNVSTSKEMTDSTSGKDTQDMTRAKLFKSIFRTLTLKLGKAKTALIVTNHTYETQEMFSKRIASGGKGGQYGSSNILFISKAKMKEKQGGKDVQIGALIRYTLAKGRETIEGKSVQVILNYKKGLNRYSGLLEFAVNKGLISRDGNSYVKDEEKWSLKDVYKDPTTFFDQELLNKIDVETRKEFNFGGVIDNEEENDLDTIEESEETEDESEE